MRNDARADSPSGKQAWPAPSSTASSTARARTWAFRLGTSFPPAGVDWWIKSMGSTALAIERGFTGTIACADIRVDLSKIACPTLVITNVGSGRATGDQTRAWQEAIPNSELVPLSGDSYHVAASDADRCAETMLEFIERRRGS